MKRASTLVLAAMVLAGWACPAGADQATAFASLAKMPVKEVTVFKDGHALVLHAGKMPTDAGGNVVMDYLPAPVLGTFWPYSADKAGKLQAATASRRKVLIERTALTLNEVLEANVGAEVVVTEVTDKAAPDKTYSATILGIPTRSGQELESTSPPGAGDLLPQKGGLVLLKTEAGTKVVKIDQIRDVTVKGNLRPKAAAEEFRNMLTLKLDWAGKPAKEADVGLMYLQKGIRWIPSYKVATDGAGKATVKLQATLINELTDLEDATVHLVVGVPTFRFQDNPDPMSLQEQVAQLSSHFRRESQTAQALSNTIMSQVAMPAERRGEAEPAGPDLGPDVPGGKKEDLFIYELSHVTLKKGQRMVVAVGAESTMPYRDVYTLELPFGPPQDAVRGIWDRFRGRSGDDPEVARLLAAPKVMHKIRLSNTSKAPLTTAPALILSGDRVMGQNLIQYTPAGSQVDLTLTTAIDVRVEKYEKESKRVPNAVRWQGDDYQRVELEGGIQLTNRLDRAVEVEVVRYVLGNVTGEPSGGGKTEMINVTESVDYIERGSLAWYWWQWYGWPYWWSHFNGIGKITWVAKLEPGKGAELKYEWHYYWR